MVSLHTKECIEKVHNFDCSALLNTLHLTRAERSSPVWKIQKMVKNPCLSVKNTHLGCEKFQKKIWAQL